MRPFSSFVPPLDISSATTLGKLVHEYLRIRHTDTVLCVLAATLISFLLLSLRLRRRRKKPVSEIRQAMQALCTVITPTRSTWPKTYSAQGQQATTRHSRVIELPLSNLTRDICAGRIELRNYEDLPDLFRGQLRVYGWLICLEVETSWWPRVLAWILASQFSSAQPITSMRSPSSSFGVLKSEVPNTFRNSTKTVAFMKTSDENFKLVLNPPLISGNTPVSCFDFVPYPQLERSVQLLQSSLRKGAYTTLEFTTLAPSIPFLSVPFILCALPFLPRSHALGSGLRQRTSTPLLTSLHRMLELLTSPSNLIIESVQNVSNNYAKSLNRLEQQLEEDRDLRTAFVSNWGVESWREHRFLLAWEAGLLTTGYLQRWIVVVRK